VKRIPLTQNKSALVDDEDFEWLSLRKWYAVKSQTKHKTYWYAKSVPSAGEKSVYMHREIAAKIGLPEVDHENGDGLNNTRSNLRPATHAQNTANRRKTPNRSSQFKGVSWNKQNRKWSVSVQHNFIGQFDDEAEAAVVYDRQARKIFGSFAKLNF